MKEDCKLLMAFLVCDIKNKFCMVHRCPHGPGVDGLEKSLLNFYLKGIVMNQYISSSDKEVTARRTPHNIYQHQNISNC